MDFWERQFQGFEEVIGWEGIMERRTGEDTGVVTTVRGVGVVEMPLSLVHALLVLLLLRSFLLLGIAIGADSLDTVVAVSATTSAVSLLIPRLPTSLAPLRDDCSDRDTVVLISTLAPPCNSSLRTRLLPRATATWIGSLWFRSWISNRYDGDKGLQCW